MLHLDELWIQKLNTFLNNQINDAANYLMKINPLLGRLTVFWALLLKGILHTIAIFLNMLEYGIRGLFSLFSYPDFIKEYFSTLGSFLVINTINALTIIPDICIRTYYAIKESKIDPLQSKHTLYYKITSRI